MNCFSTMLLFVLMFCSAISQVVQTRCRSGWVPFGQSCYDFGQAAVTFAVAEEVCKLHGASLAEIETSAENTFLQRLAKNTSAEDIWLGGTDIFDEGNWQWLTSGSKIYSFMDWAPDQPDEGKPGGEDCLAISKDLEYQWNDLNCDNIGNFICEVTVTPRL